MLRGLRESDDYRKLSRFILYSLFYYIYTRRVDRCVILFKRTDCTNVDYRSTYKQWLIKFSILGYILQLELEYLRRDANIQLEIIN